MGSVSSQVAPVGAGLGGSNIGSESVRAPQPHLSQKLFPRSAWSRRHRGLCTLFQRRTFSRHAAERSCADKGGANSMRARIGIASGLYWSGIAQAMVVITAISTLGAIGGLPALLNALIKHTRISIRWAMLYRSGVFKRRPALMPMFCSGDPTSASAGTCR
jgi:hypothetical protein